MSTGEAQKPKAEKRAKAAPREKKAKAAKTTKTASHPPYFEMVKEALVALNEKSGSSPYAIAKYMEEKHKAVLPANFRKILGLQIKNSALKGKLVKIKASYKLSESEKKVKTAAPKKQATVAASKTRASTAGTKRKAEAVKKVAKKATPTKAKQPKSIKSPIVKRPRRAAAA